MYKRTQSACRLMQTQAIDFDGVADSIRTGRTLPSDWYNDSASSSSSAGRSSAVRGNTSAAWRRSPSRATTSRARSPAFRWCSYATRSATCAHSSTSAGTVTTRWCRAQGTDRYSPASTIRGLTRWTEAWCARRAPTKRRRSTRPGSASNRSASRRGATWCSWTSPAARRRSSKRWAPRANTQSSGAYRSKRPSSAADAP